MPSPSPFAQLFGPEQAVRPIRLCRSWLFVDGADEGALLKAAPTSRADVLIQELEDFTPPALRPKARAMAPEVFRTWREAGYVVGVRINPLDGDGLDDLAAVMRAAPNVVGLPKVAEPEHIVRLDAAITRFEREYGLPEGATAIWPNIELARGLVQAVAIAKASRRTRACLMASEDLAADLGAERAPDGIELAFAEELAEQGRGGVVALGHIAGQAAGHHVAVGVGPATGAGDDMIQDASAGRQAAETIEAAAGFPAVDGAAAEVRGIEVQGVERLPVGNPFDDAPGNFAGQEDLDAQAPEHRVQDAEESAGHQAAKGQAHRAVADLRAPCESADRNVQPAAMAEARATHQVAVNGALDGREREAGDEVLLDVVPDLPGVEFAATHKVASKRKRKRKQCK